MHYIRSACFLLFLVLRRTPLLCWINLSQLRKAIVRVRWQFNSVIARKGGYIEDAFSTNLVPFVSVDWIAFPRSVAKSLFPPRIGPLRSVYLSGRETYREIVESLV